MLEETCLKEILRCKNLPLAIFIDNLANAWNDIFDKYINIVILVKSFQNNRNCVVGHFVLNKSENT